MLTLFGGGVGLWFLYGYLIASPPLLIANGLTGAQVLAIAVIRLRRRGRHRNFAPAR